MNKKPDFKAFLEENNAKKEFIEALLDSHEKFRSNDEDMVLEMWEFHIIDTHKLDKRELISTAFEWIDTPQKAPYWSNLSSKWKELCDSKKLYY